MGKAPGAAHPRGQRAAASWKTFGGGDFIPYLGVAAHADWIEQNPAQVARLYATYRQAAEWITQNPDEAAPLIAPKSTPEDRKAVATLIRANDRLGMHIAPAAGMRKEIEAVYRAGQDVGYFPKAPSADSIYTKDIP